MVYYNDHNEKTSTLTRIEDVWEVAGISYEEWAEEYGADIEKLNEALYEFTFSYEPEYEVVDEVSETEEA